jgi:dimethylamine/trimethylamine dehydrogenase
VRDHATVPRDPKYDVLFEPVRIGPKTMRNRFYQVPHCTGFGVQKPWTQARFRATKAEGGWAAVCTEYAPINPEAGGYPAPSAQIWDDGDVRALSLTADAVHVQGALAGIELHHGGVHSWPESRMPPLTPSPIAADGVPIVGKVMQRSDIRRTQEEWAAAARRSRSAGFDIVYVYGAHTFLPMQFLAPFFNQRTDEYGGSLKNRARFWLETLEIVRDAIGEDCAIASRISVDALTEATVEVEEALEFIRMADHLVDLWDVNVSSIVEWSKDAGSSRFFPEGHQLEWTARVKEASQKPVVGVSRITSPDRMVEIVQSGAWDLIGAARPSIADPFLPKKIEEGRLDEIRECIGNNECARRALLRGIHVACSQNATAGEEFRRGWHPERVEPAANADSDVLVVGAGPAGLECAIVLGRRGMRRVHLVDAETEIGGSLRWIPRLPGLGEWGRFVNYRQIQLDKLANVEFVAGVRLDAASVREYGADIVIVATGSHWSPVGVNGVTRGPIPGADATGANVLTPEQVMQGRRPPGKRVVVYDCEGYFTGSGMAELLRLEGFEVKLATPYEHAAFEHDARLEGVLLRDRFGELGIAMHTEATVVEITPGGLRLEDGSELETDAVVLVTQLFANEELYLELESDPDALEAHGIAGLYRIGDCVAPRLLADAIFDGHRLAREIDLADPATPLPHVREAWPATKLAPTELIAPA